MRDAILTPPHGSADLNRLQHHRRRRPRLPRPPPGPAADPRLHPRGRRPRAPRRLPRGHGRGEHRADRRDRPDPAPLPHRPRDQPPPAPPGRPRHHGHGPPPGTDLRRARPGSRSAPSSASTGGQFDRLYLAFASALSSTLIVVKLLSDKFELGTFGGRVTLGVLIFQDLYAIAFLAIQPNLQNLQAMLLLRSLVAGVGLVGGAWVMARFVLPGLLSRHREVLRARGGQRDGLVLPGGRRRGVGRSLEGDGRPDRRRRHRLLPVRHRGHLAGRRRPGLLPHAVLRGARPEDPRALDGRGARRAGRRRVRHPEPVPRHVPALRVPASSTPGPPESWRSTSPRSASSRSSSSRSAPSTSTSAPRPNSLILYTVLLTAVISTYGILYNHAIATWLAGAARTRWDSAGGSRRARRAGERRTPDGLGATATRGATSSSWECRARGSRSSSTSRAPRPALKDRMVAIDFNPEMLERLRDGGRRQPLRRHRQHGDARARGDRAGRHRDLGDLGLVPQGHQQPADPAPGALARAQGARHRDRRHARGRPGALRRRAPTT